MEQTPHSPRFSHKLALLQQARRAEKIAVEVYQGQLTTLIEEQLQTEVLNHQAERRAELWKQVEEDWETLEEEQAKQREKERQAEQQKLERLALKKREEEERLRKFEEQKNAAERREREQAMQPFIDYRDVEVPATIQEMQSRARYNRGCSSFFQLLIIIASTVAAGIVNIVIVPRLVTSILTIIVAIVTGVIWIFKFKEKSINSQQTADAIEYQRNLYRLGIKDYADKDPKEAHKIFAERVEDLKNEQNKRQQLLEQTSDKPIEGGASKSA